MNEALFASMLKDLMDKIGDDNGSHIDLINKLAEKYPEVKELPQLARDMTSSYAAIRIVVKYLRFDVEATRREKDQLIAQLGDQE